ncbi:hypothetical protein HAX54_035838 [Datura stramonium]|uniref:Uncharacterized protein n=1 Tax=Datura stramonium TaxID=4076 RepID=A0ABS8RMR9_DATST|nr:hypothetical protein [Datura stramonium]
MVKKREVSSSMRKSPMAGTSFLSPPLAAGEGHSTECLTCYAITARPGPEPMQLSPFARMRDSEQEEVGLLLVNISTMLAESIARIGILPGQRPLSEKIERSWRQWDGDGEDNKKHRDREKYYLGETFDLDLTNWKLIELNIKSSSIGDLVWRKRVKGEFHIEDHPSLDLDDCGDDRRDHHQLLMHGTE